MDEVNMFVLLIVWQFLDSFLSCLSVLYQCVSMSMVWQVFDGFLSFLVVFYQCVGGVAVSRHACQCVRL